MKNDLEYYLAFSYTLGIGPMRFAALRNSFGNVKKAYQATEREIADVIGSAYAHSFVRLRATFDPIKRIEEIQRKGIDILTQEDLRYPAQLLRISDPPICLYVKGNTEKVDFSRDLFFSIVGTRKPTSYGRLIAEKFSYELSQAGFTIRSGLALGIDAIAHMGALVGSRQTIAILGCGVDIIYPYVHKELYFRIIEENGLIMSEFPPGHMVQRGLFIARNRLISGLSKGLLVVEGAADSGAMITARYAAEQGKEVFAPPGPLTSEMSQAPNLLLKQGAKLVTSIADILEEFHMTFTPSKKE